MDRLKQIESFVAVAQKGSLTAAAHAEGVAPAVIGRRIDALEARLGVKLLVRTTRRITLTHEGSAYLEDCQRILADLASAEASVTEGGVKASGHLRVTAPAGFGRRHVAPLVPRFLAQHADVSQSLNLSDRVVDIVNEGFDCAVRVGDLPDSSLISVRLADNRRLCVAAPAYLKRAGVPQSPGELMRHQCLTLSSDAGGSLPLYRDGELAGLQAASPRALLLTLQAAIRRHPDLVEAVIAAMTRNPADAYGLGTKGRIEPGADADLLLLDPGTAALSGVYCAGRPLLGPATTERTDSNQRQGVMR